MILQEKQETRDTAKLLLKELRSSSNYEDIVEYSARTSTFRIKVSDLSKFPSSLERALRNQKVNSSGKFQGKNCRVRRFLVIVMKHSYEEEKNYGRGGAQKKSAANFFSIFFTVLSFISITINILKKLFSKVS